MAYRQDFTLAGKVHNSSQNVICICTDQSVSPAPKKPVELWSCQTEKGHAINTVSYNLKRGFWKGHLCISCNTMHTFVTEEMLMSAETVNAAFMSDLGGRIGKKDIKIKQGNFVSVFNITLLKAILFLLSFLFSIVLFCALSSARCLCWRCKKS